VNSEEEAPPTVSGSPSETFEHIHKRLWQEQDAEGGTDASVDYIFDVPVETAAVVCGYRHDFWKFDWGEPTFTALTKGPDR